MELPLRGELERRAGVEADQSGMLDLLDPGEARLVGGLKLLVEFARLGVGGEEEVAVEAEKLAGDRLGVDDLFDRVDGSGVALGGKPGRFLAPDPRDFVVTVVDGIREVGGGPAGLPRGDRPIVKHDDFLTNLREQIRGRQTGDPRANDADVGLGRCFEGLAGGDVGGCHPD